MLVQLLLPLFVVALAVQAQPLQEAAKMSPIRKRTPLTINKFNQANYASDPRLNLPISASLGNARKQLAFGKHGLPMEGQLVSGLANGNAPGTLNGLENDDGVGRIGALGIGTHTPEGQDIKVSHTIRQESPRRQTSGEMNGGDSETQEPTNRPPQESSDRMASVKVINMRPQVSFNQGKGHGLHKKRLDLQTKRAVRVPDYKDDEIDKDSSGDKHQGLQV
ncbi:hypothetical protein FRC15_002104 [Serendipita sp. 397]|nr:hypothetical protein FRC15_002104 [Serendipita sp. 397]